MTQLEFLSEVSKLPQKIFHSGFIGVLIIDVEFFSVHYETAKGDYLKFERKWLETVSFLELRDDVVSLVRQLKGCSL